MASLCRAAPCAAIIIGIPESEFIAHSAAGVDANAYGSDWSGVGSVIVAIPGRSGTYSGVVVGRRHVLTAAHVVSGAAAADIEFQLNHGGDMTHRFRATAIMVHPGYSGFNARRPNDDLAVIRLHQEVPPDVAVYSIHKQMLLRGELLTLVGYGSGGDGVSGETITGNPAVKRVGYNRADAFDLDDEGGGQFEVYQFDFDGPDPAANRIGGNTLGIALEATVGGGDSGSAAFIHDGRGWRLAGINTFQWGNPQGRMGVFGAGGGGMLLSGYHDWIEQALLMEDDAAWHRYRFHLGFLVICFFLAIIWACNRRWRRHQVSTVRAGPSR